MYYINKINPYCINMFYIRLIKIVLTLTFEVQIEYLTNTILTYNRKRGNVYEWNKESIKESNLVQYFRYTYLEISICISPEILFLELTEITMNIKIDKKRNVKTNVTIYTN